LRKGKKKGLKMSNEKNPASTLQLPYQASCSPAPSVPGIFGAESKFALFFFFSFFFLEGQKSKGTLTEKSIT
jgi:hypothetical protein